MIPSAPVYAKLSSISWYVRTLPLVMTGIDRDSLSMRTCERSAGPARRRRAETVRGWRVIHDAPDASRRCARKAVLEAGWQRRSFVEIGTEVEATRDETGHCFRTDVRTWFMD